jgi:hypothetical protein
MRKSKRIWVQFSKVGEMLIHRLQFLTVFERRELVGLSKKNTLSRIEGGGSTFRGKRQYLNRGKRQYLTKSIVGNVNTTRNHNVDPPPSILDNHQA